MSAPLAHALGARTVAPVRVLAIDDSHVVRRLVGQWIDDAPDLALVGSAADGVEGVAHARASQPDVIVLDVEMPRMDGLTALPQLRQAAPHAVIVVASALTQDNAEATLVALRQGAADYVAKPSATALITAEDFRIDLLEKVRALSAVTRGGPVRLRTVRPSMPAVRPEALFIGASTGGPSALQTVLAGLAHEAAPIFVVQHMSAEFMPTLVRHLNEFLERSVVEARDGMQVEPHMTYIAPGDRHMTVRRSSMGLRIGVHAGPREHHCRPAVDVLFRSAGEVFEAGALGVVLTGMGHDGLAGSQAIVNAGGAVLVQDEETSTIWGMPGAVEQAGLAAKVVALESMAATLSQILSGKAS